MAQELREGDGKSGIARAGKRKWGYDPAQVDAFLERAHALYDSEGMNLTQHDIQNVSFDLRKNGYVIASGSMSPSTCALAGFSNVISALTP